jgi:glycine cleavage system aminomethyltransferase T
MIKQQGRSQKICTLTLETEEFQPIYGGEAVYHAAKVVSRVRSGGYGFTVNRNIAFAYLPMDLSKLDTQLSIEIFDENLPARITADVLVDPKGERLRV